VKRNASIADMLAKKQSSNTIQDATGCCRATITKIAKTAKLATAAQWGRTSPCSPIRREAAVQVQRVFEQLSSLSALPDDLERVIALGALQRLGLSVAASPCCAPRSVMPARAPAW
jgi:hypothetical protein